MDGVGDGILVVWVDDLMRQGCDAQPTQSE